MPERRTTYQPEVKLNMSLIVLTEYAKTGKLLGYLKQCLCVTGSVSFSGLVHSIPSLKLLSPRIKYSKTPVE